MSKTNNGIQLSAILRSKIFYGINFFGGNDAKEKSIEKTARICNDHAERILNWLPQSGFRILACGEFKDTRNPNNDPITSDKLIRVYNETEK